MKRPKKPTYKELEQSYKVSSRNLTAMQIALNDLIRDEIVWACGKRYTVGLTRLDSACGGLVVLRFHPGTQPAHAAVYYFEEWSADLTRQVRHTSGAEVDEVREIMGLRSRAMVMWEAKQ